MLSPTSTDISKKKGIFRLNEKASVTNVLKFNPFKEKRTMIQLRKRTTRYRRMTKPHMICKAVAISCNNLLYYLVQTMKQNMNSLICLAFIIF